MENPDEGISRKDDVDSINPENLREYTVRVVVSGDFVVTASSKQDAIEQVKEVKFGDKISRANATVVSIKDLPAEEDNSNTAG